MIKDDALILSVWSNPSLITRYGRRFKSSLARVWPAWMTAIFLTTEGDGMKRLGVLSAALALAGLVTMPAAQAAEKNGLGVYVSNFAGSGLTYTRVTNSGWGLHLSGFAYAQNSTMVVNYGGAITKEIAQIEDSSVYALLGTGIGYFPNNNTVSVNIGPGIGLRMGPLTLEAGFSLFSDPNNNVVINGTRQLFGFGPSGGAGLSFWF